jgi:hypothetical protein
MIAAVAARWLLTVPAGGADMSALRARSFCARIPGWNADRRCTRA